MANLQVHQGRCLALTDASGLGLHILPMQDSGSCQRECQRQPACVAVSASMSARNSSCSLYYGSSASLVEGDGAEGFFCMTKSPSLDDGFLRYPTEFEVDLVSAILAAIVLPAAASALMAHPAVRQNWRMVHFAALPLSFFGVMMGIIDSGNPLIMLAALYPLKGFCDPFLDISSMRRGAHKGVVRVTLPFLQALTHHVGTVVLISRMRFLQLREPYTAALSWPLPWLGLVVTEVMSWCIEAHILARTMSRCGTVVNYFIVLSQVAMCLLTKFVREVAMLPLMLIAVGNLLYVLCALLGYKRSSHEYFEEDTPGEKPTLRRAGSVARTAHSRTLEGLDLRKTSATHSKSMSTLTGVVPDLETGPEMLIM